MLPDLRNRGVADLCIVCCDGLKGLPDAIRTTWPDAEVLITSCALSMRPDRWPSRPDLAMMSRACKP